MRALAPRHASNSGTGMIPKSSSSTRVKIGWSSKQTTPCLQTDFRFAVGQAEHRHLNLLSFIVSVLGASSSIDGQHLRRAFVAEARGSLPRMSWSVTPHRRSRSGNIYGPPPSHRPSLWDVGQSPSLQSHSIPATKQQRHAAPFPSPGEAIISNTIALPIRVFATRIYIQTLDAPPRPGLVRA